MYNLIMTVIKNPLFWVVLFLVIIPALVGIIRGVKEVSGSQKKVDPKSLPNICIYNVKKGEFIQ